MCEVNKGPRSRRRGRGGPRGLCAEGRLWLPASAVFSERALHAHPETYVGSLGEGILGGPFVREGVGREKGKGGGADLSLFLFSFLCDLLSNKIFP